MIWGMNSPTFRGFVDAAQRVQPQDHLVCKKGRVGKKLPYEKQGDALNQKTWAAFKYAIGNAFTTKRRGWICDRYGFDWDNMVNSDHPLERRYVEYFGVGAETASTYNLQEMLRKRSWFGGSNLGACSVDEIYHLHQAAVGSRFLGNRPDPVGVSGAPRLFHENFAPDYFEMDRQRCNLFRGIADLVSKDPQIPRLHPYYSRLNMGIISLLETEQAIRDRELVIPAPGPRDGELDYYKVHDIVSFGGMTAVALVPISDESTLQPIVAFRCTKQTLSTYIWTTLVGITPGAFVTTLAGRGLNTVFETSDEFSISALFNPELKIALIGLGILALVPIIVKKWMEKKKRDR